MNFLLTLGGSAFIVLSWRESNPYRLSVCPFGAFRLFVLMGVSPLTPKKAENPSKNITDRCLAVLPEQIFAQARRSVQGILSYWQGLQRSMSGNLPVKT
ncbi:MAG: hypothetical protein PUE37_05335, partial [Firmicutes bacterium]|nr:hypothetical protein [Bacillota bacterium]